MALLRDIFRIRPVKGRIFYLSGLIILFRTILLISACFTYLHIVYNCDRLPAVLGKDH